MFFQSAANDENNWYAQTRMSVHTNYCEDIYFEE